VSLGREVRWARREKWEREKRMRSGERGKRHGRGREGPRGKRWMQGKSGGELFIIFIFNFVRLHIFTTIYFYCVNILLLLSTIVSVYFIMHMDLFICL